MILCMFSAWAGICTLETLVFAACMERPPACWRRFLNWSQDKMPPVAEPCLIFSITWLMMVPPWFLLAWYFENL